MLDHIDPRACMVFSCVLYSVLASFIVYIQYERKPVYKKYELIELSNVGSNAGPSVSNPTSIMQVPSSSLSVMDLINARVLYYFQAFLS